MSSKSRRTQTQRPSPRVADEIRDRKMGLHLGRRNVFWAALAALVGIAALLVAVAGPVSDWWMQREPAGAVFVAKPSEPIVAIYAIPTVDPPFTYVVGGTQLRVDCVKEVDSNKHGFGHISDGIEQNRWVDITDLLLPNGDPRFKALAELPELDICG